MWLGSKWQKSGFHIKYPSGTMSHFRILIILRRNQNCWFLISFSSWLLDLHPYHPVCHVFRQPVGLNWLESRTHFSSLSQMKAELFHSLFISIVWKVIQQPHSRRWIFMKSAEKNAIYIRMKLLFDSKTFNFCFVSIKRYFPPWE